MNEITTLHREAMNLAEMAAVAKIQGDPEQAVELSRRAFEYERDAAHLVKDISAEPTRSILYRSAASLALDYGDLREAERLIATALVGNPPEGIAEELRDLLEQVYFQRHLELRGWQLEVDEVQLSIAGNAVGFGIASSDEFVDRIQDFEKLIYRTAERKSGAKYREGGNPKKAVRKDFGVYMSVPRAASLAVSLRVGLTSQLSLDYPGILDELLNCLDLFNEANEEDLRQRIPEEAYYRNFMGLARKLAPDGDDVNLVGFTAIKNGEERKVALTRSRSEVSTLIPASTTEPTVAELVTVTGFLKYADSRRGKTDLIKLEDQSTTYDIIVPEGMMSDIVKPLWDDEVKVIGTRTGQQIYLEGIEPAKE